MKVLDKATFLAWLKVGKVFRAAASYNPKKPDDKLRCPLGRLVRDETVQERTEKGKPKQEPKEVRVRWGGEAIDQFEAWDAVEQAIREFDFNPHDVKWIREACYKAGARGYLEYTDGSYEGKRDQVIREVARRW